MKQNNVLLSLLPALVAAGPGINPNPNKNFNPATSQGTFGPFIIPQAPSRAATGGPTGPVDVRTLQAMQLAISNWMTDTGIVSGFQNIGGQTTDNAAFMGIADGAFKAEVDELSQKAVLDQVIGNDPRISIANLTLTNGVFQSVVDNLQIMSIQGQSKANLIDAINQVRCTQILPSIDTYMLVAAEYIGDNAQQRRAVRPTACAGILAQNAGNSSAFPAVPGTPAGTPVGAGDGIIQGVPNACGMGAGISTLGSNSTTNANNGTAPTNTKGGSGGKGGNNAGAGKSGSSNSAPLLPALNNQTTPQLGLPGFTGTAVNSPLASSVGSATPATSSTAATGGNTQTGKGQTGQGQTGQGQTGAAKKGKTSGGRFGGGYPYHFKA